MQVPGGAPGICLQPAFDCPKSDARKRNFRVVICILAGVVGLGVGISQLPQIDGFRVNTSEVWKSRQFNDEY